MADQDLGTFALEFKKSLCIHSHGVMGVSLIPTVLEDELPNYIQQRRNKDLLAPDMGS